MLSTIFHAQSKKHNLISLKRFSYPLICDGNDLVIFRAFFPYLFRNKCCYYIFLTIKNNVYFFEYYILEYYIDPFCSLKLAFIVCFWLHSYSLYQINSIIRSIYKIVTSLKLEAVSIRSCQQLHILLSNIYFKKVIIVTNNTLIYVIYWFY